MSALRRDNADIAVVVVSIGISAVLSLVYNAFAGRWLGPARYSDFAGAIALATLLALALGALTLVTAQLSASYAAAGQHAKIRGLVGGLLRPIVVLGLGSVVVGAAIADPVASALRFSSPLVVPAAVAVFLGMTVASIARAALRGSQLYGDYSRSMVGEAVIRLVAGIFAVVYFRSAALAVVAYALAVLVVIPAALRVIRRLSDRAEPVDLRQVASLLGPTALLVLAMALYQNVDLLVVKRLFDPAESGVYAAAATLAKSMVVISMPLEALLVPRLTYLLGRRERVTGHMSRLLLASVTIAAVPLLAFAIIPTVIVAVVYGSPFAAAARLLFPLAASVLLVTFAYLAGQVLISVGKGRAVYPFAVVVVIEVILLILVPRSLEDVVLILVSTRMAVLIVMLLMMGMSRRRLSTARIELNDAVV